MNSSRRLDDWTSAFTKNFITFVLGCIINCINGAFVYIYLKHEAFQRDPRYVLYIHLVINDIIMLTVSMALHIITYTTYLSFTSCCIILLISTTVNKNSPLNLAGMAVERYVAVCLPLHHVQICTVQRAYAFIALIWVVSVMPPFINIVIVLATQPLAIYSSIVICHPNFVYVTPYHKAQNVAVQVCLVSFVFLTVIITYLKVFAIAQSASGSNQASAKNVRNTILLHGVQLLLCMLIYIAPFINLALLTAWPHGQSTIYFASFLFANVLPRLLSPLIYGVRDQKFSSCIKLHFGCSAAGKKVKQVVGRQRRSKQV